MVFLNVASMGLLGTGTHFSDIEGFYVVYMKKQIFKGPSLAFFCLEFKVLAVPTGGQVSGCGLTQF